MQPISVIAPYLPTQLHRQRDAARKEIGRIFAGIIAKRRASGVKENDILQTFIDGRYKRVNGGRALTEGEITGMLIAALFAGMHTSTITSSWTGIFLASHRKAWDACVAEQRRIVAEHGEELSVEVLDKMEVLHACITEALRLHPPLIMMLRYARKAFEVTGALCCSHHFCCAGDASVTFNCFGNSSMADLQKTMLCAHPCSCFVRAQPVRARSACSCFVAICCKLFRCKVCGCNRNFLVRAQLAAVLLQSQGIRGTPGVDLQSKGSLARCRLARQDICGSQGRHLLHVYLRAAPR